MLFPDLCTQLFDGSTSNGFEGWGPASKLPNDCEDSANVVSVEDDCLVLCLCELEDGDLERES